MSNSLLSLGGLIFIITGLVHGLLSVVDVFRPTQFTPKDDAVREAMKSTTVRFLKARASVWDAWLGFNISHGLGMFMFGAATIWLGLNLEQFKVTSAALLIPVGIGFGYFLLSLRFWFYLPSVAFAIATACFAAAWWRH